MYLAGQRYILPTNGIYSIFRLSVLLIYVHDRSAYGIVPVFMPIFQFWFQTALQQFIEAHRPHVLVNLNAITVVGERNNP